MNLFPATSIPFDLTMVARFVGVSRSGMDCVGRYALMAGDDALGFADRLAQLQSLLGLRYAPLPGTWASFVANDDDTVEFRVGLDRGFGKALVRSHQALRTGSDSLVAPLTVRALGLGYLSFVGVR